MAHARSGKPRAILTYSALPVYSIKCKNMLITLTTIIINPQWVWKHGLMRKSTKRDEQPMTKSRKHRRNILEWQSPEVRSLLSPSWSLWDPIGKHPTTANTFSYCFTLWHRESIYLRIRERKRRNILLFSHRTPDRERTLF